MGSWVGFHVEVSAADRDHANTQFGYVREAIERLPFVVTIGQDGEEYEDERE